MIPGLGSSLGEGNGYPLQYSRLENSMDRRAWWVTICGVTKSWTQLSDQHNIHYTVTLVSECLETNSAMGSPPVN